MSMGTTAENIAATNAISLTDSEVAIMSNAEFRNEKLYQTTMSMARKMLGEGIISEDEYRETRSNLEKRKAEGCGVVEMECASIMAVGQFRKKKVYQFLYAADCLADSDWDKRILGNMPTDLRERILLVAIEVATRL